ncbi:MAG: bifunctional folylpolyglutamate synthase/dihydrofolate synthase, partial [Erysipelothrix sp.]|nr:bifunctional folylpolyglutamate synthase/dihydrofolate synthase [Erysipelothrix sp.]
MKPFTNLDEALATLHQRTSSSRFGLRHFKQCVADLGNPQLQLKVVHVAGTNGKGSVSNYVATTLELANYKVGLYTSPFLITHNDRFRINHQP